MSEVFNAKAARAKRPCPIWVDAFQRDTQHLEADEVGAYFLIIMAMWTRESCDLPDDDNRLSRIARVSVRLWKSRVGVVIRALLLTDSSMLVSKRLKEEAAYVEGEVQKQSDRKRGSYAKPQESPDASDENAEKSCNPLENIDVASSVDTSVDVTMDNPQIHPSQQPNNLHKKEKKERGKPLSSASDDFENFWIICPRKISKEKARQAYVKALRKADEKTITDGMARYAATRAGEDAQFTAHPATWLNGERWTDQPDLKTGMLNAKTSRGDKFLNSFLAGSVSPPALDFRQDCNPARPLLARG